MEFQETKLQKIKRFITECKRVLKVTRKPDSTEFKTIVKVSGLGIILIGAIGFTIEMVKRLIIQGL
jgi:protein transport protein SEC61 subunit gamma and related proteins